MILGPGLLVPVRITAKDPGRSWDWRIGPLLMRHEVAPDGDRASRVSISMTAPTPVELAVRAGYGPLITPLLRNLARVAAQGR